MKNDMKKKKNKEFDFYWEQPDKKASEKKNKMNESESDIDNIFSEPLELTVTFPVMKESNSFSIAMDETDKNIIVKAELSGFRKSDIRIKLTEGELEIAAAKRDESRSGTSFERLEKSVSKSFTLPSKVNPDKADVRMDGSILTITIPKIKSDKDKEKKKRKILGMNW